MKQHPCRLVPSCTRGDSSCETGRQPNLPGILKTKETIMTLKFFSSFKIIKYDNDNIVLRSIVHRREWLCVDRAMRLVPASFAALFVQ